MDKRDFENKDYNQDIDKAQEDIQEENIQQNVEQDRIEQVQIDADSTLELVEYEEDVYYIEGDENAQVYDFNIEESAEDVPVEENKQSEDDVKREAKNVEFESVPTCGKRKRRKSSNFIQVAVLLIICSLLLGTSIGLGYKLGENYFAFKDSNANQEVDGVIPEAENTASDQNQGQISNAINNPINGGVSLADLAENTKKAVVAITSHEITRNYLMGTVETPTSGTGIVYQMSKDKIFIVTNSHVVGEGKTSVKFEHQSEPVDVEFIGRDEVTDVAVLSVKKSDLKKEALSYIKPIKFANSDKVRVGDFIMVVGNPLGYDYTTTFGIVSGLNRNTQLTSEDLLIQVDAAVNRGNSGGPLVNMSGELIGIINQKMNQMTAEGIGFAIPSNRVMEDVKFLVENKENPSTSQAFLGITGEAIDESAAQYYRLPLGVLVRSTMEGSPAEKSGIKEADIIVEADGKKITNMVELQRVISRKKPSDEIVVKILRVQEGELNVKVTLGDKSKFNLKY